MGRHNPGVKFRDADSGSIDSWTCTEFSMRRYLATLVLLVSAAPTAMADAPFMPVAAPDHVVIMTTKNFGRESGTRTHTHHAGWTRIDVVERGRPSTRYFAHTGSILVNAARDASGAWLGLSIRRGDEPVSYVNRDRFETGETRAILNETCHVWNIARATRQDLAWLSCVTNDGIELWSAARGARGEVTSATATRVERRPVAIDDVRPPVEALQLRAWNEIPDLASKTAPGSPGDFEAVIEPEPETTIPSARVTRIVRRHHPWILIDDRGADGQRHLAIRNEASGFSFGIQVHAKIGLHTLTLNKFLPPTPDEAKAHYAVKPVDLKRSETVRGETCHWFDAMPNIADAGLHECRTTDGVVLKELRSSWGHYQTFIATRLTRRSVALSEVLPPADMLAPRSWGLPE
jgi:hypothetical protein